MADDSRAEGALSSAELALLAHEVRGALTVVSGLAELTRRPLEPDEHEAAVQGILRAVARIDRLMQSALDGTLTTSVAGEPIRLATLAQDVAAEQRAISERTIDVHVEADPVVLGASDALERALGNLIGNALKYSLLSSPVDVFVGVEHGSAYLSVADRGPGIPKEDRERVLEPFQRLAQHEDVPGTGLGLTVVRSVAESIGGRIRILDRAGGGAVVRIELPLAPDRG